MLKGVYITSDKEKNAFMYSNGAFAWNFVSGTALVYEADAMNVNAYSVQDDSTQYPDWVQLIRSASAAAKSFEDSPLAK